MTVNGTSEFAQYGIIHIFVNINFLKITLMYSFIAIKRISALFEHNEKYCGIFNCKITV